MKIPNLLLSLKITIIFAILIAIKIYAANCDGDPKCVSWCKNCPNDQSLTGTCCFSIYRLVLSHYKSCFFLCAHPFYPFLNSNENLVWSPSGQAELCQGTSASKNPPESCQSCLQCDNANTCSTVKCSSTDTGTCCYARSDPNSRPDEFEWYCKGCANCPSGYYQAAYETTKANCRACKSGESSSSGNCI